MIRKFNDYEQTKSYSESARLPKGGYVMQIKEANIVQNRSGNGEHLVIFADIAEGDYNGYFLKDYQRQEGEDKKWRGKTFINIPTDDGSESDSWTKRRFKTFTEAVEDSNEGYHFDWDEKKFKGKFVGALFNEREWESPDGKIIKLTNWAGSCSVDKIRNGSYTLPKDQTIDRGYQAPAASSDGFMQLDDVDLTDTPFR